MPLRLQNSPDFELLRNYLLAARFNETTLCGRLGIQQLVDLLSNRRKLAVPQRERDEIDPLMHFLLLGDSLERKELESTLSLQVVEALTNLGLVSPDPADGSQILCPVALYPMGTVFVVSDRWVPPDGKPFEPPADFVYPAITPNTRNFLGGLPSTPCDSFLEMCSGAGPAALEASRYAHHAWAVDITERSTQVAEFNRLLNGLENFTALKGDCYEGLDNLQFDRIVAHPPYLPVVRPAQIFSDGGQDGEQVTRRIVEGLPRHLKPGGCFYCVAQGSDRKNAPLEQRLRGWLGESQADFDVAVIEHRDQRPEDAALYHAMKSKGGYEALNSMRHTFSELGIESLSYGWMIIQRKLDARKAFTVRRSAGRRTGREEIAWVLKWETFAAGPLALKDLQEMAPIARPSVELRTVHRLKEGELVPEELALHTEDPFAMSCKVQPWMAYLIPLCDGRATVRQLWETCKANNLIQLETPLEEFARLLGVWISGGFIEVADYRLPNPRAGDQPSARPDEHSQNQAF